MVRQFVEVKQQYPGVILFYRMGDFYETFFEDAIITARALEITLTGRDAGKLGRIPMAGVPVKAVETYLQRLLEKNFKVAICEQMEDPAQAKGLVERRVTRVISKGTLSDSQLSNPKENNYLAALFQHPKTHTWGLAYCDVTTGEFWATQVQETQTLLNELDRIRPGELLVLGKKHKGVVVDEWVPHVDKTLIENRLVTPLPPHAFEPPVAKIRISKWFQVQHLQSFSLENTEETVQAIGALLGYLEQTYIEDTRPAFSAIQVYHVSQQVVMTSATRRHLELTQTLRDNRIEGSLLWVLDQTQTPMGGRLLRHWIQAPTVSLPEIDSRLDSVEALVNHPDNRESLQALLPQIYDLERLAMKVQNQSASPRDLVALKRSCQILPQLAQTLQGQDAYYLSQLQHLPQGVLEVISQIETALRETPALSVKEGNLFKPGYHAELDKIIDLIENQDAWLTQYENQEREQSGIKTLKVAANSAFGYYIEISKAAAKEAPAHYHRKQTLSNAERYITPELKAHEEAVFEAQQRRENLEYQLYLALKEALVPYGEMLRTLALRVAALDVLQSFALVAVENQYCRPQVDEGLELVLHQARHPVIEKILPLGAFVSNDCHLSSGLKEYQIPQLIIITGPNMAGKSTFMRQVALCVLMAQMGSFVPASYARIGLVDQIHTRIGAVDDLSSGQSTFMVEMTETAQILHSATQRSLVLLDEVGRGTSTYDGVAIAWSVAEQLIHKNQSRTLFATHYHELNTLESISPKIQNFRVLVSETEGDIQFLHSVAPGAAQKSYGIQVAKMAGLPANVISKAEKLLSAMHEKEYTVVEQRRQKSLLKTAKDDQLTLFS